MKEWWLYALLAFIRIYPQGENMQYSNLLYSVTAPATAAAIDDNDPDGKRKKKPTDLVASYDIPMIQWTSKK